MTDFAGRFERIRAEDEWRNAVETLLRALAIADVGCRLPEDRGEWTPSHEQWADSRIRADVMSDIRSALSDLRALGMRVGFDPDRVAGVGSAWWPSEEGGER
jgi:hypothetical protein